MRLRGIVAGATLAGGVLLSATSVIHHTDLPDTRAGGDDTLALAPISLGNPAAAATLDTRGPGSGPAGRHAHKRAVDDDAGLRPASLPDPADPDAASNALPGTDDLLRAAAPAIIAPPTVIDKVVTAGRGDTMMGMLTKAGVSREEAHAALAALSKAFNPRRFRAGQDLTVTFRIDGGPANPEAAAAADSEADSEAGAEGRFTGLSLEKTYAERVVVDRDEDDRFRVRTEARTLSETPARAAGTINSSLYVAATKQGLPVPVLTRLIRAYSWDVDFQREIRPGDTFEVMYTEVRDESGAVVHYGDVAYAALRLSGELYPLYRYTTRDGETSYFDQKGRGAQKALMRTPIDGARLSSGFGRRRHPILGYSKMHRGTDFAAPKGTPIYAAGDGVVDYRGRKGGYGNYIRIRHNDSFSTAYAHMSRYAKKATKGARVKQGQVIGYVGTTGRSTGPHLHYEILKNGQQVNPMKVRMPSGRKLKGQELDRFQAHRAEVDRQYAAIAPNTKVATSD